MKAFEEKFKNYLKSTPIETIVKQWNNSPSLDAEGITAWDFIEIMISQREDGVDSVIKSGIVHLNARKYAEKCHKDVNHLYDGKPYEVHLKMAYDYGIKYIDLIPLIDAGDVIAAIWAHDLIEDARQTYNDVKRALNVQVAELVYAVTNGKGKNRSERADHNYYKGIRDVEYATFVKLCDRLANIKYSIESKSSMLKVYNQEMSEFKIMLYDEKYDAMFRECELMLEGSL